MNRIIIYNDQKSVMATNMSRGYDEFILTLVQILRVDALADAQFIC